MKKAINKKLVKRRATPKKKMAKTKAAPKKTEVKTAAHSGHGFGEKARAWIRRHLHPKH